MARPSEYSIKKATSICEQIADGDSLRKVCEAPEMPSTNTVFRWLREHDEFRDQYARAREDQAETYADQIIEIADEDPALLPFSEEDGKRVLLVDGAAVQLKRLRVDARKWHVSKMAPKKYGDKIEHSGTVTLAALLEKQGEKE